MKVPSMVDEEALIYIHSTIIVGSSSYFSTPNYIVIVSFPK